MSSDKVNRFFIEAGINAPAEIKYGEFDRNNFTPEMGSYITGDYNKICEAMGEVYDRNTVFLSKYNQLKYYEYAESQILSIINRDPWVLRTPQDIMQIALRVGMFKVVEKGLECKDIATADIYEGNNLAMLCAKMGFSDLALKAVEVQPKEALTQQFKMSSRRTFGMYAAGCCEDDRIYKKVLEIEGAKNQVSDLNETIESCARGRETREFKPCQTAKDMCDAGFSNGYVDETSKLKDECKKIDSILGTYPIEGFFDNIKPKETVDLKSILDFIYDGDESNPEYQDYMNQLNELDNINQTTDSLKFYYNTKQTLYSDVEKLDDRIEEFLDTLTKRKFKYIDKFKEVYNYYLEVINND